MNRQVYIVINSLNMIKMAIREPKINAMNTVANPLMILGIFIFVAPFILSAFKEVSGLVRGILTGMGILFFMVGLVWFVSENL